MSAHQDRDITSPRHNDIQSQRQRGVHDVSSGRHISLSGQHESSSRQHESSSRQHESSSRQHESSSRRHESLSGYTSSSQMNHIRSAADAIIRDKDAIIEE